MARGPVNNGRMTTTLTRWGHACVRIDAPGGALVIDPGTYSDLDRALDSADAVLVTHVHPDHLDAARVAASGLPVWGPAEAVDALAAAGAPARLLHTVAEGDELSPAGLHVQVLGQRHAVIHPDLPPLQNVAYLVGGAVLHPGDSLPALPAGAVRVLLVPVSGAWVHLDAVVDWVRALHPDVAVPIHDAMLSPPGQAIAVSLMTRLCGVPVTDLTAGEPLPLPL